jgi:ABC-type lipoprotein release transport system permease subunit
MDAVAREIPARQPDARVTRRDDVLRTYDGLFDWRGGILAAILAFSALAFLVLIWDKASGLPPEERGEVGVLRAIGWEPSDVFLLKFCEGAVVSFPAFLCGTLLAYAHVFPGKAFLITPVLKGWSTLYPEFLLTPSVGAGRIALLFGLTVAPYSAVAALAARRAIAADPEAAMR